MHPEDPPRLAGLCVGDELLDGRVRDSNAVTLGRACRAAGWLLVETVFVPDDPEAIVGALRRLGRCADAIVVSGGLGPTLDDRTRDAIAHLLDVPLVVDETASARLAARASRRGRTPTTAELRQARFPAGARIVRNGHGTADGFVVENGVPIVCLPGVPTEFSALAGEFLPEVVRPGAERATERVRLLGIGESDATVLVEASGLPDDIAVTWCAHLPYVDVELTGNAAAGVRAAAEILRRDLGPWALPAAVDRVGDWVAVELSERGLRCATAESCTGGLIASQLTDVPGASTWFERGFVTYSNASKAANLGVLQVTLKAHGAVSAPTAAEMARGALGASGADVAVAVTGIAGPAGGSVDKPVGTVFLGVATARHTVVLRARFGGRTRAAFKTWTAALAQLAIVRVATETASELSRARGVVSLDIEPMDGPP